MVATNVIVNTLSGLVTLTLGFLFLVKASEYDIKKNIKKKDSIGTIMLLRENGNYTSFIEDVESDAVKLEWKQFISFYSVAPENYECNSKRIYYKGQRILLSQNDYNYYYIPWLKQKYIQKYDNAKIISCD